MASKTKIFIRVLLALAGLFVLIFFGFGYFIYSAVDSSIDEAKRVQNLPEVKGIVCSQNKMIAPISGDSVAFYMLEYRISTKSSNTGRTSSSTWYKSFFPHNQSICLQSQTVSYSLKIPESARLIKETSNRLDEWHLALTLNFKGAPDLPPYLLGLDDDIDCAVKNIYKNTFSKDIDVDCPYFGTDFNSIRIEEFTWKKGDTLGLKGEIIGDDIELLW